MWIFPVLTPSFPVRLQSFETEARRDEAQPDKRPATRLQQTSADTSTSCSKTQKTLFHKCITFPGMKRSQGHLWLFIVSGLLEQPKQHPDPLTPDPEPLLGWDVTPVLLWQASRQAGILLQPSFSL